MDAVWPYLTAVVPTIVVATFFYFIIKHMIEGDRRERLAQARFEADQDRRSRASETASASADPAAAESAGEMGEDIPENPRGNANDI